MAVSKVSPLAWNAPIVDEKGNPTPYFVRQLERLLQEKAVTDTLAEGAVPNTRLVTAGTGLTGGGALTSDITLNVDTTAEAERIRDVIGTALVAGSNITITVNDGGDTITIASSGGGGGSLALLNTQTVSAASSVIFGSSYITSTYSQYMLRWFGVIPSSTTSTGMGMQLSPDNGTTWRTTGYNGTRNIWQINSTFSSKNNTGTTYLPLSQDTSNDTTYPHSGEFVVSGLANASVKKLGYGSGVEKASDGNRYQFNCGGEYNTAEAINAIRVIVGTGTITGTFKLYGIS